MTYVITCESINFQPVRFPVIILIIIDKHYHMNKHFVLKKLSLLTQKRFAVTVKPYKGIYNDPLHW